MELGSYRRAANRAHRRAPGLPRLAERVGSPPHALRASGRYRVGRGLMMTIYPDLDERRRPVSRLVEDISR
jgi:hypothetical protein